MERTAELEVGVEQMHPAEVERCGRRPRRASAGSAASGDATRAATSWPDPEPRHGRLSACDDEDRPDHRHHRPGRLLPRRAPPRQGLRGPRHHPPRLDLQHRPDRPHLPGPARRRTRGWSCTTATSPTASMLVNLMRDVEPDEVYHLGAQSHVKVSFEMPEYTGDVTGRRHHPPARGHPRVRASTRRFYQASSSEMFGSTPPPQNEETPFHPRSPYGCAKVYALLGDGQLPRGLRHARDQRDPLQPREPAPRRDLRDPQDHPRGRPDRGRASRTRSTSATSTPCATGATPRSTSRRSG